MLVGKVLVVSGVDSDIHDRDGWMGQSLGRGEVHRKKRRKHGKAKIEPEGMISNGASSRPEGQKTQGNST